MDDELKPCPFCGSDAAFGVVTEGGEANPDFGGHFVQCENTKCHGCMGLRFACGDDPRPALADAWNSRADTPIIEAHREDAAPSTPRNSGGPLMVEVTQADQALLIDLLELDDEQADRVRAGTAYTAEVEALARHRLSERAAVVEWLRAGGASADKLHRLGPSLRGLYDTGMGVHADAIEAGEHHA